MLLWSFIEDDDFSIVVVVDVGSMCNESPGVAKGYFVRPWLTSSNNVLNDLHVTLFVGPNIQPPQFLDKRNLFHSELKPMA